MEMYNYDIPDDIITQFALRPKSWNMKHLTEAESQRYTQLLWCYKKIFTSQDRAVAIGKDKSTISQGKWKVIGINNRWI